MTDPALARAAELLDLIKAPTSIATVVLIGFAVNQLKQHATGYDGARNFWAFVASVLALAIATTIVLVMTPLAYEVVAVNSGSVETLLLVYWLSYLVAIGTAAYCGWITYRAVSEWRAQKASGNHS